MTTKEQDALAGPAGSQPEDRHLRVLRDLLQRDYLGRADWSYALRDLAELALTVLDCAQAVSEETLAAELFGYAPRSGFANAPPAGRPGAAELAHRGSLFLDEVGTLPRELQQRLLMLIQTG